MKNSETIAFLQPRFGPYHVARLRAVIQSSEKTHFRVLPIQISASDQYSWPEDTCSELGTLTLSPVKYEAITKNAISSLLNKTLGSVRPSAIFINGWGNYDSRVALRWAVENGTPVVISCDSRSEDYRRSWLRERLKARVVALGDAFFVSGTQSENYLISLRCPRNKIVKGVDVVDNKFYSRQNSVVQEEKSGEKRPYFVCCGRFVEKKNYAAFVKTYIHTYLRYPGSIPDLHLVGDGPLRNQIERTAGKMLGKNIKLHGFLGSSEVRRIFHGAHAFFHPATYDQWGLVVNEAMAAGLPVAVSSASGCCKDLVEHRKNGWRFDSACSEDVAETILKAASLSKLEWLSMSKASVAKISDWGLDRHVKAFWSVHAIALESRAKFLVGHQNIRHLTARLLTTF